MTSKITYDEYLESVPLTSKIDSSTLITKKDYKKHFFKLYKFVSLAANYAASIDFKFDDELHPNKLHLAVLMGQLNRCSRLMLSNITLFNSGCFGETVSIIDRCIAETTIICRWLCFKNDSDAFERYINQGLRTEVAFKKNILSNISNRNGKILKIEERMIKSIDLTISESLTDEVKVCEAKKLPSLEIMLKDIGSADFHYTIIQRLGSHHIHGTWPSLLFAYLEKVDGKLLPRGADLSEHVNQMVFTPLLVMEAIRDYLKFLTPNEFLFLDKKINFVVAQIIDLNQIMIGNDFQEI